MRTICVPHKRGTDIEVFDSVRGVLGNRYRMCHIFLTLLILILPHALAFKNMWHTRYGSVNTRFLIPRVGVLVPRHPVHMWYGSGTDWLLDVPVRVM